MKDKLYSFLALLTIIVVIYFLIIGQYDGEFRIDILSEYSTYLVKGLFLTILISLLSFLLSILLGLFLYYLERSKYTYLRKLERYFSLIILGTPLYVLIIITAFFVGQVFSFKLLFLGIISLVLYMGPYIKNVLKSAIEQIDKEQLVTIDLYGFNRFQKYRYIIFPQIIKSLIPPMMNNFSYLIKGTALLNIIAINEYSYKIKIFQSQTFAYTEGYLALWIGYLIITIPLLLLTEKLEKRLSNEIKN